MTLQKEIREGLATIVCANSNYRCECGREWRMPLPDDVARVILQYLRNKGVVINIPSQRGECLDGCSLARLEPLIEGVKE